MRVVLDTNVLVSALLSPDGALAAKVGRIFDDHVLLASAQTLIELVEVLGRPKLRRYVPDDRLAEFLILVRHTVEMVTLGEIPAVSRDPKDDKFLAVAVAGAADAIVSGDRDLLTLHPYHGIPIVAVADFEA